MTTPDGDDEGNSDDVRAVWRRDPEAAWAMRREPTGDGDAHPEAGGAAGTPPADAPPQPANCWTIRRA